MTQDDMLAAVAYLEAVWDNKRDGTAVLASRGEGEKPILNVVLDLAEHVTLNATEKRLGIHDGLSAEQIEAAKERIMEDREMQWSILLLQTLRTWCLTAQGQAQGDLCLAVIRFMVTAFKTTDHEVPLMLASIRKGALAR